MRAAGTMVPRSLLAAPKTTILPKTSRHSRFFRGKSLPIIQDDVGALAVGGLADLFGPVFFCVVDEHVGAEGAGEFELFLAAGGGDDGAGPEELRHLDGEGADAARRGVDQDALAIFQGARGLDAVVGCQALQGNRGGPVEVQALGEWDEASSRRDGVLRVA